MLLCLRDNIETVEEYAKKIGTTTDRAESILKEKVILDENEINANCKLFNVSANYFLCLVER